MKIYILTIVCLVLAGCGDPNYKAETAPGDGASVAPSGDGAPVAPPYLVIILQQRTAAAAITYPNLSTAQGVQP